MRMIITARIETEKSKAIAALAQHQYRQKGGSREPHRD